MSIEILLESEVTEFQPGCSVSGAAGVSTAICSNVVTPGKHVASTQGFMRGHGTYTEDDELYSSVGGFVEQVNKLISVKPVQARYSGEIGDVVVGRITEVQQRRWRVDTNSRLDSLLPLSSVNLPGGELRRKSAEDELAMRNYLQEGDLISAEIQSVYHDGSLALHTRSLKYGKLSQGVLVSVPAALVRRRKSHFHNLPCGVSIILGNNGYIWVSRLMLDDDAHADGGYAQNLDQVITLEERQIMARVHNCLRILADYRIVLFDTTVIHAYNASMAYQAKDLLKMEIGSEIAKEVRRLLAEENT